MTDPSRDLADRALALVEKRVEAAPALLVAAAYIFVEDLGPKGAAEFWEKFAADVLTSIKEGMH
jgi:hypothetical protein